MSKLSLPVPAVPAEPVDTLVTFAADYDHHWPSRAVTAFKAGWSGRVKREVAVAAGAKGVLEANSLDDTPVS